jgi:hypothetical protein
MQGMTQGLLIVFTEPTGVTGDMMGDEHPITNLVFSDVFPDSNDIPSDLMAKDLWCFLDTVPFHDIAAADATSFHLDQKLSIPNRWDRHLLDTHIIVVVVHRDLHRFHTNSCLVIKRHLIEFIAIWVFLQEKIGLNETRNSCSS